MDRFQRSSPATDGRQHAAGAEDPVRRLTPTGTMQATQQSPCQHPPARADRTRARFPAHPSKIPSVRGQCAGRPPHARAGHRARYPVALWLSAHPS
ncbi:hypothetical protein ATSB10_15790 [Dyella thiooxydans]|uniref:Uncharacterized protein n=1 Tax=Dyella thiooxydans TaxID=445710 RepID=A0A160MZY0_9GAMM|nr:hypothetical protein ATSB10_15790 [Dyella thiooxydans]